MHAVLRGGIAAIACIGAGAAFLIMGIAGVAWRSQCASAPSAGLCGEPQVAVIEADPVVTGAIAPDTATAAPGPAAVSVVARRANPVAAKLQAADLWIADTFEVLVDLERGQPAKPAAASQTIEVTTRKVRTVAVGPGGLPAAPQGDAVAETATVAKAEPPVTATGDAASATLAVPEPLAFVSRVTPRESAAGATAPMPATRPAAIGAEAVAEETVDAAAVEADTRTVKGAGVNVRSGPAKSRGKVFALKGGEKVTVVDRQKGWLKVKDARGRSGWVYSDYLS